MAAANKKEGIKKEFKGDIEFRNCDSYMVRTEMDSHPGIMSNRRIDFARSVLPNDFESEKYTVTGRYVLTLEITEK